MKRKWDFVQTNRETVASMKRHPPLEGHPVYPKVRALVNETIVWLRGLDGPYLRSRCPALLPPLLNQLGRSATSVSANLAEGEGRTRSTGHYRQFVLISRGSLVESIDHFSSLEVLEDLWADDPKISVCPVKEIRAKWETILEDFDQFLAEALDPEGADGSLSRVERILKLARSEGKLATSSIAEPELVDNPEDE